MSTDLARLAFRDKFRSLFGTGFQDWFIDIAHHLYPGGDFQAIRQTSGDGGLDGYAINSYTVYQVYAPSRISEMKDSETASKIKADFAAAIELLPGQVMQWNFLHNHPEGKIGKKTAQALSSIKSSHPTVNIQVLNINALWDRVKTLDPGVIAKITGVAAEVTDGRRAYEEAKNLFSLGKFIEAVTVGERAVHLLEGENDVALLAKTLRGLAHAVCESAVAHRHSLRAEVQRAAGKANKLLDRSDALASPTAYSFVLRARTHQLLDKRKEAKRFCDLAMNKEPGGEYVDSACAIRLLLLWEGGKARRGTRSEYQQLKLSALKILEGRTGADAIALRSALASTAVRFKDDGLANAGSFLKGLGVEETSEEDIPLVLCSLTNVVHNFCGSNMFLQAQLLTNHGIVLSKRHGSPDTLADLLLLHAEVSVSLKDRPSAVEAFQTCLELARREARTDIGNVCHWLQLAFAVRHNFANYNHEWLRDNKEAPLSEWNDLSTELEALRDFVAVNEPCLAERGPDVIVVCEWLRGEVLRSIGRVTAAAECFRAARLKAVQTSGPRGLASEFQIKEAECLALAGAPRKALEILDSIKSTDLDSAEGPRAPIARKRYVEFRTALTERVLPLREWWDGPESTEITDMAASTGIRQFCSTELEKLFQYFDDLTGEYGSSKPVLYDFWGRGRFLRIAAAIRSAPEEVIAVDAHTVDDIRKAANALCPLFSTVIVKWKAECGAGLAIAPYGLDWIIEGQCGGGYSLCLGSQTDDQRFTILMGQGVFLPPEVVDFIHSEARNLVTSGRLLICPATAVGCLQAYVGWSDELLQNGFLSGVVAAISGTHSDHSRGGRLLDLSAVSLPCIRGISLNDLGAALNDVDDLLAPYRKLVFQNMQSGNLSPDRWDSLRLFKEEAKEAVANLDWQLTKRLKATSGNVSSTEADVVVTERLVRPQGNLATDLLQSISREDRLLAPWVPYWRFKDLGGQLDWYSKAQTDSLQPQHPELPDECFWLLPPTHGVSVPVARRE